MKLPWKGGRASLVVAASEGSYFFFFLCAVTTLGTVAFSFLSPQIIRLTIDSVIGDLPPNVPAFIMDLLAPLGGFPFLQRNIWFCALLIAAAALLSGLCNSVRR